MNKIPKLLLADDSMTIRKVVELTFADEGIEVTTATDAESAMQKFVEIQPDIVLADVGLAGMSGYRICEMIKQDEATRHIPVLLLVGSFEPFDQTEAENACADGFLTKPFVSIRDLVTRVTELLEAGIGPPTVESDDAGNYAADNVSQFPAAASPETADIDNLYNRSHDDTLKTSDFDDIDLLDGPGMDDELIETSRDNGDAVISTTPVDFTGTSQNETKEFDWSPQAYGFATAEPLASTGVAEVEVGNHDDNKAMNEDGPDVVDGLKPARETNEGLAEPTSEKTVEMHLPQQPDTDSVLGLSEPWYTSFATGGAALPEDQNRVNDEEAPNVESAGEPIEPVHEISVHDTVPDDEFDNAADSSRYDTVKTELVPSIATSEEGGLEPSPEMITLIAQRVIEKLSDKVVREIAQEAVPRIAEKLIREALAEETKN